MQRSISVTVADDSRVTTPAHAPAGRSAARPLPRPLDASQTQRPPSRFAVERREVVAVRASFVGRRRDHDERARDVRGARSPARSDCRHRRAARGHVDRQRSPGRASSRARPRPGAARRAARRAACGAHCRRRSARTARRGCCACRGTSSRASASVSISFAYSRRSAASPASSNSASRNATSNGALWMIHSAPRAKSMNSAATSRNFGLPLRSSQVMPCTSVAPASISRSGSTWNWIVRPVGAPVDELERRELDDPMALLRVEAGGFGVEDDLAHSPIGYQLSAASELP